MINYYLPRSMFTTWLTISIHMQYLYTFITFAHTSCMFMFLSLIFSSSLSTHISPAKLGEKITKISVNIRIIYVNIYLKPQKKNENNVKEMKFGKQTTNEEDKYQRISGKRMVWLLLLLFFFIYLVVWLRWNLMRENCNVASLFWVNNIRQWKVPSKSIIFVGIHWKYR